MNAEGKRLIIERIEEQLRVEAAKAQRAEERLTKALERYDVIRARAKKLGLYEELCEKNGWAPDHLANDVLA
jgi:DNA-binding protein H-NS